VQSLSLIGTKIIVNEVNFLLNVFLINYLNKFISSSFNLRHHLFFKSLTSLNLRECLSIVKFIEVFLLLLVVVDKGEWMVPFPDIGLVVSFAVKSEYLVVLEVYIFH